MNTIIILSIVILLTIITIIFCYKRLSKLKYEDFQSESTEEFSDFKPEKIQEEPENKTGAANLGEQLIWDRAAVAIERMKDHIVSDKTTEEIKYSEGDEIDLASKAIDKLNNDPDRTFCARSVYGPEPDPEIDTDNMYTTQDTSAIEIVDEIELINDNIRFDKYLTEEEADKLRQRPSAGAPCIKDDTELETKDILLKEVVNGCENTLKEDLVVKKYLTNLDRIIYNELDVNKNEATEEQIMEYVGKALKEEKPKVSCLDKINRNAKKLKDALDKAEQAKIQKEVEKELKKEITKIDSKKKTTKKKPTPKKVIKKSTAKKTKDIAEKPKRTRKTKKEV